MGLLVFLGLLRIATPAVVEALNPELYVEERARGDRDRSSSSKRKFTAGS